ncbi:MAG: GTPase HflX [Acidobacteriota bacterium]|nr:GTPase HflX [Acidobacteriota bacterium]
MATDRERAVLVSLDIKRRSRATPVSDGPSITPEESLAELKALTESAGASVEESVLQSRPSADAATLIGSGKVEELKAHIAAHEADVVVFDTDLTPTQLRNLERALDCKILDRTQLILDIFARRARTSEGQLQVELAQLNYILPRLSGHGAAMSRLGGGIGTRGPGETKLETDRRRISKRIKKLQDDLEGVRAGRGIQRRQRQSVPLATIALVGYTNAGKSTLFNRLTGAGVTADARMFATLDPTVRHIILPSRRKVLLSDTVGFIRNLPTTLVKAFRATLEEVVEATVLLHVVDASSPHAEHQTAHVLKVLSEIGAGATRQILVLNKADLLPPGEETMQLAQRVLGETHVPGETRPLAVSARTGEGLDALTSLMDEMLGLDPVERATFRFPAGEGAVLNTLHEQARVLETRYAGELCEVEADAPESVRKRLEEFLVA